ncbi:MAG: hypothetical protein M1836_003693 [Candelina mexicana]|nr:MAG: hypothetical protein M1836_003693 [Candelina mexicana]
MATSLSTAQVHPNRSVGFFTLGASLHDVLTRLKAQPQTYPSIDLSYSPSEPIANPVILNLPANGFRLRFDGPDQRLRLIEVLDFTKTKLSYKNTEIVKLPPASEPSSADIAASHTGPAFRHVYNRLFGPAFPGEYIAPNGEDASLRGTYVLSYPGIAFSFPLQASAWSPSADFVSLLSSSATSSATSMAVFEGSSWSEARIDLFNSSPQNPRSLDLASRGREGGPDEIELVKVHGEGRIELIRRSSPPFWITLSETAPQDLVTELGPPDAIYRKNDRRLSIHKTRTLSGAAKRPDGISPLHEDLTDTDQSSTHTVTDESDNEDDSSQGAGRDNSSAECFYNYFHHGFDIFVSQPTIPSPPSPSALHSPLPEDPTATQRTISSFSTTLTATKLLLHANIPGSYPFNRYRRSRWTLEHVPLEHDIEALTSEMPFEHIASRLKEVWKSSNSTEEEEKSLQRGMVLNRDWGDSPGSSCELLGGWEESVGGKRMFGDDAFSEMELGLGNTELFGFPGMVFEVLKNGAVSCLTVF